MKLSKGFTLIELLVVIGVLGILATGLLAAVDPFEQLKKARDANNRNIAIETLDAFTRYYATHGNLPWNLDTIPTGCATTGAGAPLAGFGALATGAYKIQDMNACITNSLISDGELKSAFFSGLGSSNFYIASGNKTNVVVCFLPEGKALINDKLSSYLVGNTSSPYTIVDDGIVQGGTGGDACPGTAGCAQCFQ